MSDFTIRITLHGATADDYRDLYSQMALIGASRTIRGTDGLLYDLPDGEYLFTTTLAPEDLRDRVVAIAGAIRANPSVLVTRATGWAFWLSPVPGQS